jgi:hypothetical protein
MKTVLNKGLFRHFALVMIIMFVGKLVQAQTDPMQELLRLRAFLDRSQTLNFNLAYYYEEDDSAGVIRDTLTGEGSIFMGKSYTRLNGMKKINNENYNAMVDTVNKEIFVTRPEPMTKQYMDANFTDPAFYNFYVDTTTVTDSGSFRIITFNFKETAPFNWYRIVYSATTLQPAYLHYGMKKTDGDRDAVEIRLKLVFSNFNTNAVNPILFTTDPWFIRQNGALTLQPAYSDYTITDLTEGG